MPETSAQRALTAATISLAFGLAAIAMFLPPLLERTLESVLRIVGAALVIAIAVPLHAVFVGIAAGRMQRSVPGWVSLSLLLFPVGSVAALTLLHWLGDEASAPPVAAHHG